MKNKKSVFFIFIFLLLLAFCLLGTGLYLDMVSRPSAIFGVGVDRVNEEFKNYFYPTDDLFLGDNYTLEVTPAFQLGSEYYVTGANLSEEEMKYLHLIHNLNQLDSSFTWIQSAKDKKAFLEVSGKFDKETLIDKKIVIDNSTKYYFLDGLLEQYVNDGTCNYFEAITGEYSSKSNMDYLSDFLVESLKKNLLDEYFSEKIITEQIQGKNQGVKQISIRLDDKRIHTILKNMVKDLKEDTRSNLIMTSLDPEFSKYKIDEEKTFLEKDESITILVSAKKLTYEPVKVEIIYLKGNEKKSYVIEMDGEKRNIFYSENDQAKYEITGSLQDNSMIFQIFDSFGKEVGEFKMEKEKHDVSLTYSLTEEERREELLYSRKVNIQEELQTVHHLTIKKTKNNISRVNGEITVTEKMTKDAKVDIDLTGAVFASKLSEEQNKIVSDKWDSVRERMER